MAKHAFLSASASHRWINCPPSAKLCEGIKDESSHYAQEGTDCHELCAYLVEMALGRDVEDPTENLTYYSGEMSIDLETYSDVDIKKSGVYKYAESENFEILLFAVSINGDDVIVYDLACGDVLPDEILDAIVSDDVIKWAFNASFERICLSYWMKRNYPDRFCSYSIPEDTVGNYLNPASWRCTMIWSAYMGLPLSLEGVGTVLGLKDQKMKEGKDLIRYFCVPCKPTKSNGGRTRNLPMHAPEKWTVFKSYNKRDVEVEMGIKDKLHKFPVPDFVWEEYHLDQEINDRGILVDLQMVENAITFDERSKATIADEMRGLTDIDNPNSVSQMKSWLSDQGIEVESLGKKAIAEMIKDAPEDLAQVLSLRQQLAKSSVKKYQAMQNAACIDHRTRGMFQFYGANRTGRWAGRLIQLQNLPQNHMYTVNTLPDDALSDTFSASFHISHNAVLHLY